MTSRFFGHVPWPIICVICADSYLSCMYVSKVSQYNIYPYSVQCNTLFLSCHFLFLLFKKVTGHDPLNSFHDPLIGHNLQVEKNWSSQLYFTKGQRNIQTWSVQSHAGPTTSLSLPTNEHFKLSPAHQLSKMAPNPMQCRGNQHSNLFLALDTHVYAYKYKYTHIYMEVMRVLILKIPFNFVIWWC